jgi:hypothetical protein
MLEKLDLSVSSRKVSLNTYGNFTYHSNGVRVWTDHYSKVVAERIQRGIYTIPNSKKAYDEFLEDKKDFKPLVQKIQTNANTQ